MGKYTQGCSKNLLPVFWGAVVLGLVTFIWVLFNKGTLGVRATLDDADTPVKIQRMNQGQMGGNNRRVGNNQGMGNMQTVANTMAPMTPTAFMPVATGGASSFANVIPVAQQVVVNISASANVPVTDPRIQQNQPAFQPQQNQGNPAAAMQNQAPRQRENEGRQRGNQNAAPPPQGNFSFVDPFKGTATESIGSGVIIDPTGHILTNFHVIERATAVVVTTFVDGNAVRTPAAIEMKDEALDLAILKIDVAGNLPHAHLGDSSLVKIGDPVIAIGSPFGLSQTVTQGIISGQRQSINIQGIRHANLFQTDASINKGNSGGPMFSLDGEVIGINTAIYSPGGTFAGVGFAIPANQALDLIAKANIELPMAAAGNMGMNAAMMGNNMGQPVLFGVGGSGPTISCNQRIAHGDRGACVDCHMMNDGPCTAGQPGAFGQAGMNANMTPVMGGQGRMNANMDPRRNNAGGGMNAMGQPVVFGFGTAPPIPCNSQLPHPYWGECINCHKFNDGPCNQVRVPGNQRHAVTTTYRCCVQKVTNCHTM